MAAVMSDAELEREENALLESDDESELPPTDIVAYSELRSCSDIHRMYTDGLLDLHPEFQREEVWKNTGKTRFVDSLIKQLPIPSLCLAYDYKTEKRQVIDGLQRISTIVKFLNEEKWILSRLDDVDQRISGKANTDFRISSSELFVFFNRVKNATLPITVLRCDISNKKHQSYLFTIFHRLNTGGMKLNNQEIRNCIFQGSFNSSLRQIAQMSIFKKILGFEADTITRFKVEELILRVFAYSDRYQKYSGRLASFLNDYMGDQLKVAEEKLDDVRRRAASIAQVVEKCLPQLLDGRRRSLAIIEALLVGINLNIDYLLPLTGTGCERITAAFDKMLTNDEFSEDRLRGGLADSERVKGRIGASVAAFAAA